MRSLILFIAAICAATLVLAGCGSKWDKYDRNQIECNIEVDHQFQIQIKTWRRRSGDAVRQTQITAEVCARARELAK